MQSFVEYLICKYFVLPQVINFDEVQFISSDCAFGVIFKNCLPNASYGGFLLKVLGFNFGNFLQGARLRLIIICVCVYFSIWMLTVSKPCVEKTVLSPMSYLYTFIHICVVYC